VRLWSLLSNWTKRQKHSSSRRNTHTNRFFGMEFVKPIFVILTNLSTFLPCMLLLLLLLLLLESFFLARWMTVKDSSVCNWLEGGCGDHELQQQRKSFWSQFVSSYSAHDDQCRQAYIEKEEGTCRQIVHRFGISNGFEHMNSILVFALIGRNTIERIPPALLFVRWKSPKMGEKVGVWLSLEPKQVKWLETMTKKYGLPTAGTYYYRVVLLPLAHTTNTHQKKYIHITKGYGMVILYYVKFLCVCVCVCVCVAAACLNLLQNC